MAFTILITEADRKRVIDLYAHVNNKSANEHEAETARVMLVELIKKYGIKWGDLTAIVAQWKAADDEAEMKNRRQSNQPKSKKSKKKGALDPLTITVHLLKKYVDMAPLEYVAIALWIFHTHIYEQFKTTPRLGLTSTTIRCGKTNTVLTLKLLCYDPTVAGPLTTVSAFFRKLDQHRTVIVDEVDNFGLLTDDRKRGVINQGFDTAAPTVFLYKEEFNVFAPLVLAGIGCLPEPVTDRSIGIHLERSDNQYPELDDRNDAMRAPFDHVLRLIQDWAQNVKLNLEPEMPPSVRSRNANKWRVLLAIADSFGPEWGVKAREAAVLFSGRLEAQEVQTRLLLDIEIVFNTPRVDRISSADLLKGVLEHGTHYEWTAYRGPKDDVNTAPHKLTHGDMSRLISMWRYEGVPIRSTKIRFAEGPLMGFKREWFEKHWKAYRENRAQPGTPELKVIEGSKKS